MIKQKNTAARISTEVHTKAYFSYHSLILEILRGEKKKIHILQDHASKASEQ